MSTAIKWIIAILCLAAIGWLLWWSGWLKKPVQTVPTATTNQQATTTDQSAPINGMSANNDASDQAIDQDAAAIDAQMKAYNTDTANVDTSMNDKEVTQ